MHETSHTFLDRRQRTVLVELDDDSLDLVILVILVLRSCPRIFLECFDRERDLTFFDLDDLHLDLVSHTEEHTRILDKRPVDL